MKKYETPQYEVDLFKLTDISTAQVSGLDDGNDFEDDF